MKPAHFVGIVLAPRKPKGGACCEKCGRLRFRDVIYKTTTKCEAFCADGHEPLVAKGCDDFDDVSVDSSRND